MTMIRFRPVWGVVIQVSPFMQWSHCSCSLRPTNYHRVYIKRPVMIKWVYYGTNIHTNVEKWYNCVQNLSHFSRRQPASPWHPVCHDCILTWLFSSFSPLSENIALCHGSTTSMKTLDSRDMFVWFPTIPRYKSVWKTWVGIWKTW